MRPAQKAPENKLEQKVEELLNDRFNEAGAKSAGKQLESQAKPPAPPGFNEAGAKSAGKPS